MCTFVELYRRRLLVSCENRPTRTIVDGIVWNFIYEPHAGEDSVSTQDEMEALHLDVDALPYLDEAEAKLDDHNGNKSNMSE